MCVPTHTSVLRGSLVQWLGTPAPAQGPPDTRYAPAPHPSVLIPAAPAQRVAVRVEPMHAPQGLQTRSG